MPRRAVEFAIATDNWAGDWRLAGRARESRSLRQGGSGCRGCAGVAGRKKTRGWRRRLKQLFKDRLSRPQFRGLYLSKMYSRKRWSEGKFLLLSDLPPYCWVSACPLSKGSRGATLPSHSLKPALSQVPNRYQERESWRAVLSPR